MIPTITAFERSPDRGRGLARDMRVRWAFEEVGQPYEVRLLSFSEMKESAHRMLHPFGQIPTYQEGDLGLTGDTLSLNGKTVADANNNNPATNFFTQQIGRAQGRDIVQTGPDPRGGSMRWMFSEIEPSSFRWTAERAADERNWRREVDIRARRA